MKAKEVQALHDEERSSGQITRIKQTYQAIVSTSTKREAAQLLNIDESSLYRRLQGYPEVKQMIADHEVITPEVSRQILRSNTIKAARKLEQLLEQADSEHIQLNSATEILDRTGVTNKKDSTNVQVNVLNHLQDQIKDYDL